jgi:acyl-CoA synthetase (AMP-forming)/AMP-acid ligase II
MILLDRVREIARRTPRARALSEAAGALTYAELAAAIDARAESLARGSGPVGLEPRSPIEFVVSFFSAGLAGRAAAVLSASTPPQLQALREDALTRFPPRPGTTVFYSSGSVGPGRAVPLSHENLAAAALAFESWNEITAADRVAIGLSPGQILGLVRGALNTLAVGAEAIFFHPRRDPLEEADRHGASLVLLPSALARLAARHASRPRLRALLCGGGAVEENAAEAIENRRGVPVRCGYGMTETAGLAARQPIGRIRRPGSSGLPAPGMEVSIVSEDGSPCPPGTAGEVRLAGAAVFSGYLLPEDPSPLDAQGRLRTGDVGLLDGSGELFVRGRLAFALSFGDRVLCAEEVEAALAEHPAVAGVAAVPLDRSFGALVVTRDGATLPVSEIRAHAERRLPAFARPRRILGVPELPRTPGGKVDRVAATRWLTETGSV